MFNIFNKFNKELMLIRSEAEALSKEVESARRALRIETSKRTVLVETLKDELALAHERQHKPDAKPSDYMRGLSKALYIIEAVWGADNDK